MERETELKVLQVYDTLDFLYRELTEGTIPEPGYLVRGVSEFPNGSKFEILKYNHRICAVVTDVTQTDEYRLLFGITYCGLSDISFRNGNSSCRVDADVKSLDSQKADTFRMTAIKLLPWLISRQLDNEQTPLPESVVAVFTEILPGFSDFWQKKTAK